jgi:hypothetical protein
MARKLGPYQIHSELGRGAMAVVWRAHDSVLERDVAIKEPLLANGIDAVSAAEFGARFVREAKAAARLNHPNIVTIHAADIYNGQAAIVMELVQGETLGQILERGPMEPKLAMSVLEQLLSAVGYAHERGIVHRDIKPDNIFLTPEGRVKLADFGIASLASDSTLTQAGTVMGTPGYMAPEQITGAPVDARADIFAIGALAYEMLTGKNPFGASEGAPTTTIMYRIVHQAPPEMPAEALAGLPADLRSVLQVALAKDPADRFPDAASFLAALKGEEFSPPTRAAAASLGAGGHLGGTILGRLSAIKSATMISRGPANTQEATWRQSWVPYAAVAGVGLIIMIALLVSSRGGGGTTYESTTTEGSRSTYLALTDSLVHQLQEYDVRIAELATVINSTIPNVPDWVSVELQSMADTLYGYLGQLQAMSISDEYVPSYQKLSLATNYMIDRAEATEQAVEITRASGSSGPAKAYYAAGRNNRDKYRTTLAEYFVLVPQY